MKNAISAVILTKNEEQNITDCLKTLSWCDEIIVVDDNSIDKTAKLAEKFGANVFVHSLANDFSRQRNFGLQKTAADWILFIDADERVNDALQGEISQRINLISENTGYVIKRRDIMWGKELKFGETANLKLLRLAKKNTGIWSGAVHEKWRIKGNIGELRNSLIHYPHQTLKKFIGEINFYTDLRAIELYKQGKKANWVYVLVYPIGKFLFNYFLKGGIFDGVRGLLVAIAMSLHSFLVRAKLYMLSIKK